MGIGIGILLLVIGLILLFAIKEFPDSLQEVVEPTTVGWILVIAGVLALVLAGWKYAYRSWGYLEVSVNSPAGIPVFQLKSVIVAAGLLLLIQGVAQVLRCIVCIRTGEWPGAG